VDSYDVNTGDIKDFGCQGNAGGLFKIDEGTAVNSDPFVQLLSDESVSAFFAVLRSVLFLRCWAAKVKPWTLIEHISNGFHQPRSHMRVSLDSRQSLLTGHILNYAIAGTGKA
jgi:hypothetical protein